MGIQEVEGGFHDTLRYIQERRVGLIPEEVDIIVNMSLGRSLIRGSTTEVLNRGLDT